MLRGRRALREFLKLLFFCISKSLRILKLSCSFESAGFKSISALKFSFSSLLLIIADAFKTSGPLIPKWVKSISPCLLNSSLFLLSKIDKFIFLRLSPCNSFIKLLLLFIGTKEGVHFSSLSPNFSANL